MKQIYANNFTTLEIGRKGENLARQVVFDIRDLESLYGPGDVEVIYQRPGDAQPYPLAVQRDGTLVTWDVTATDTEMSDGYGKCELRYYVGETLAKSKIWRTWVEPAMDTPSEAVPPEPQKGWVDQVLATGVEAQHAANSAKADADRAAGVVYTVNEAGSKAVQSVQSAGDAQVQRVTDEGTTQTANAKAQANAAAQSASGAAQYAKEAAGSASEASTSETNAKSSENAAKASENAAKASETAAKESETTAKSEADRAKSEADRAAGIADAVDVVPASTTLPKAPGEAAVGDENAFARGDHVHPRDNTKQDTLTGTEGQAVVFDAAGKAAAADTTEPELMDIPAGVLKGTSNGISAAEAGKDYMGPVAVTAADNGKFLRVVNGAWAADSVADASGVSF